MGDWFDERFERENVHSSYDFRRKSYWKKIVFWLILIALGVFVYFRFLG